VTELQPYAYLGLQGTVGRLHLLVVHPCHEGPRPLLVVDPEQLCVCSLHHASELAATSVFPALTWFKPSATSVAHAWQVCWFAAPQQAVSTHEQSKHPDVISAALQLHASRGKTAAQTAVLHPLATAQHQQYCGVVTGLQHPAAGRCCCEAAACSTCEPCCWRCCWRCCWAEHLHCLHTLVLSTGLLLVREEAATGAAVAAGPAGLSAAAAAVEAG
jgi:hypothetical protein